LRWARHIISAFKVHRKRARSPFHKALYESGNVSHFKIEEVKVVENRIANDEEKKLIEKYTKKGNSYNRPQKTSKADCHGNKEKTKNSCKCPETKATQLQDTSLKESRKVVKLELLFTSPINLVHPISILTKTDSAYLLNLSYFYTFFHPTETTHLLI